jgi:hypothetical protein
VEIAKGMISEPAENEPSAAYRRGVEDVVKLIDETVTVVCRLSGKPVRGTWKTLSRTVGRQVHSWKRKGKGRNKLRFTCRAVSGAALGLSLRPILAVPL